MEQQRMHVVVLGAGYAGVMAANRLAGAPDAPRVTLVNAHESFVQRIRLHEYAAGGPEPTVPFASLLRQNIRVVIAEVKRILPAERQVLLTATLGGTTGGLTGDTDGTPSMLTETTELPYDYLVYALGSAQSTGGAENIVADNTGLESTGNHYSINNLADARALRTRLSGENPGQILVLGAGHTGVEAASEIAAARQRLDKTRQNTTRLDATRPHVVLQSTGQLLPGSNPRTRRKAARILDALGVELREHQPRAQTHSQTAQDGIMIRCTGFDHSSVAATSGLPVDVRGRLRVDATLRCTSAPEGVAAVDQADVDQADVDQADVDQAAGLDRIFGGGDGVRITTDGYEYVRQSCAAALPQGAHVADSILRILRAQQPQKLNAGFVARCMSSGRSQAIIELVNPTDRPRGILVSGWLGARTKEAVCNMTLSWIRQEMVTHGRYRWFDGPRNVSNQEAGIRHPVLERNR